LFSKESFLLFLLKEKVSKKFNAAMIAPRMRPGPRAGQQSLQVHKFSYNLLAAPLCSWR
jgi:hypothetical protein